MPFRDVIVHQFFFYIGKETALNVVLSHGSDKFSNLFSLAQNDIDAAKDASRMLVSLWYDSVQKYKTLHGNLDSFRT